MFFNTLSGRFLGLTIIIVLIAEVLIFVPSVARFRVEYLQNRLELAELAALAQLSTPPEEEVSPELERILLDTADVFNVVLRRNKVRELVLEQEVPAMAEATFDLRDAGPATLMRDALMAYLTSGARVIRVIGRTGMGERSEIEVTLREAPLRAAMIDYGLRILYVSLAISVTTAALLFLAVRRLIVRPMSRVVASMTAYREAPEDATRVITPQSGVRELRAAETALQDLQRQVTAALRQRERLAALGSAVAKVSHDLRNILATAQLLADRIEGSADPAVRRVAPKLVASIARAVALCERTLTYGRAEEPPPALGVIPLAPLVEEVVENETAAASERVRITAEVAPDLTARADADQLFRALTNLVRNAAQAIEGTGAPGEVRISAADAGDRLEIRVADTGPGLPAKARENLFQPFRGAARQGGAGLGLAIAAELAQGHGGALALERDGPDGVTFRITLPGAASAGRAVPPRRKARGGDGRG